MSGPTHTHSQGRIQEITGIGGSRKSLTWADPGIFKREACYCTIFDRAQELHIKARITLCVFLMLRWQLSPTQMKFTCKANGSTYITLCFLIRIKYFGGHTQMLCTFFLQKRVWLVGIKSLFSVPNADCFAFF